MLLETLECYGGTAFRGRNVAVLGEVVVFCASVWLGGDLISCFGGANSLRMDYYRGSIFI